jgi:Spy/CpxP family protein refolding chaperone
MANMSTALNQLYAALTPEQKTLIDQHMSAMHQHHGMHAGHGG